jgi:murein tripeptide amidase MpaA
MVFYSVFRLIHSALHGDQSVIKMLTTQTLYIIPVVNVDGFYDIQDLLVNTGRLHSKRKNKNPTYGNTHECGDELKVGVDLNRNYGFGFGRNA